MPSSRQVRMTRSAISPRFATRTFWKSVRSGRARPLRRACVRVVPAAEVAVDPFGIGIEAAAQLLVEGVLLRRARVLHVGLAAREVNDEARASFFAVLPQDLRAEIADSAFALAVVPLLAERKEFAELVLPHFDARDRAVHRPSAQSGMFPCLRRGLLSRLVDSDRNAATRRGRVSCGSMTSSM